MQRKLQKPPQVSKIRPKFPLNLTTAVFGLLLFFKWLCTYVHALVRRIKIGHVNLASRKYFQFCFFAFFSLFPVNFSFFQHLLHFHWNQVLLLIKKLQHFFQQHFRHYQQKSCYCWWNQTSKTKSQGFGDSSCRFFYFLCFLCGFAAAEPKETTSSFLFFIRITQNY